MKDNSVTDNKYVRAILKRNNWAASNTDAEVIFVKDNRAADSMDVKSVSWNNNETKLDIMAIKNTIRDDTRIFASVTHTIRLNTGLSADTSIITNNRPSDEKDIRVISNKLAM